MTTLQITDAQIYSINNNSEIAYELTYTGGSIGQYKNRAIVTRTSFIRAECLIDGNWVAQGKTYKIEKNKKRNAEKIKNQVTKFLNK